MSLLLVHIDSLSVCEICTPEFKRFFFLLILYIISVHTGLILAYNIHCVTCKNSKKQFSQSDADKLG